MERIKQALEKARSERQQAQGPDVSTPRPGGTGECHEQLAKDCKGVGIGKYCGMRHRL